jgi:hypothetical protein
MKLVHLPNTRTAVNPAWITCVINHPDAKNFYKEPWPHVSVHWCYGVQQGQADIKGVSFEEIIALINEASK